MNYYIDFDHTLYNTKKLTEKMLNSITDSITKQKYIDRDSVFLECKKMFNRENIYNIYELVEYFSKKYSLNSLPILEQLDYTILNRSDLLFDDVKSFLERLKLAGHKIFLFSDQPFGSQFSITKIAGSHLVDLVDGVIFSSIPKYELDIDFSNGIFIDDHPEVLKHLYSKNPLGLIRIRRKGEKYSPIEIDIDIEEYETLDDVPIK